MTVTFEAYTSGAVTETPAAGNYISGGGGSTMFGAGGLGAELVELAGVTATGGGTVVVGNAGNGAAFSVEGPVTALTHCIATVGLYPPRP
ncbi:hypothetical protein [Nisaea denitrificans]|uniref:hypothetical protein n=1 Tax=Nisaea denitrificans TaxID=390877 RepID=UPI001FE0902C|nr:hypothetical protein [Nisaea denitrificans]